MYFAEELTNKCQTSAQMRSEVELIITHFPGVIREANKRRDTPPHCMFAIEELVGRALTSLKQILLPGQLVVYVQQNPSIRIL